MRSESQILADLGFEPPPQAPQKPVDALPATVSLNTLCELLGVNATSIGSAVRKGHIVKTGHNAYDLKASLRNYCEALRDRPQQQATDAKERLTLAQAELAETKLAEARGELVRAADVESRWSTILSTLRASMLGVPARVQTQLGHLTAHDVEIIDREIRDTLLDLGGGDAD